MFSRKMLSLFLILSKGEYGCRVLEMEAERTARLRLVHRVPVQRCWEVGPLPSLDTVWDEGEWAQGKVWLENLPAVAQGFPSMCAYVHHASRRCWNKTLALSAQRSFRVFVSRLFDSKKPGTFFFFFWSISSDGTIKVAVHFIFAGDAGRASMLLCR